MNAKLEVIELNNEDILTTSSVVAVIKIYSDPTGKTGAIDSLSEFWVNKKDVNVLSKVEEAYQKLMILYGIGTGDADFGVSQSGYYHLNDDGTVGSPCNDLREHPDIENILG